VTAASSGLWTLAGLAAVAVLLGVRAERAFKA
jgi:hypothetical protein